MQLSDFERDILNRAVTLRSTARGEMGDITRRMLITEADFLIEVQRKWHKQIEDFDKLVECIERHILNTSNLTLEAGNVIKRYRQEHPRRTIKNPEE